MSCTITQDLCLQQGASKTYLITVLDDNGDPVNLTGGTVVFTVRQNIGDVSPVILKTSGDIAEIEILTQVAPTLGQAKLYIVPGDTSALLTAAPFVYDIWFDDAGGDSYPVVAPSCLTLEPSARFP